MTRASAALDITSPAELPRREVVHGESVSDLHRREADDGRLAGLVVLHRPRLRTPESLVELLVVVIGQGLELGILAIVELDRLDTKLRIVDAQDALRVGAGWILGSRLHHEAGERAAGLGSAELP